MGDRIETDGDDFQRRAEALIGAHGLVDLHVDSLIQHTLFGYDLARRHRAGVKGQPLFWHADLPRMSEAGYSGACMGIHYFPWESSRGAGAAHRQIDALDRFAAEVPGCIRVRTPDDWGRARRERRIALAPGVEGAHMLCGSLDALEALCDRNIAYLTLAHFSKNSAATPSLGRGANEDDGLTGFGREVVAVLNRRGVVVDVAHLNQRCAIEAAEASAAPVFATHSGAQRIHPHPRLLSDAALDAIAEKGGVIGVIFSPDFLAGRRRAGTEVVVDHIEAIADRVGPEHVALGSDYDGWLPAIPSDQRDCRDIRNVAAELLRRGHPDDQVRGILCENAERVMRAAWELRER